eukprot:TRINITY_DN6181_c1_g1_i1.p2 TRINITY_DN6181_c1_g1~~TRINITY_DN6181_c1_g1_i1.p2  ORF type:complete len:145 (-),score=35.40 TRINITY_DN6181_c1_g1_i1:657-1049(-)
MNASRDPKKITMQLLNKQEFLMKQNAEQQSLKTKSQSLRFYSDEDLRRAEEAETRAELQWYVTSKLPSMKQMIQIEIEKAIELLTPSSKSVSLNSFDSPKGQISGFTKTDGWNLVDAVCFISQTLISLID